MNVNGVKNNGYFERTSKNKNTEKNQDFKKDFLENVNERLSGKMSGKKDVEIPVRENSTTEGRKSAAVQNNEYIKNLSKNVSVQDTGRISAGAVIECSARYISYSESDNVKIYVEEGFVFKAQVQIDKHLVYIEQKNEDGTVKGYEVNPLKLDKNTEDLLEQMALESWEMARSAMAGFGSFFTNALFSEVDMNRFLFNKLYGNVNTEKAKETDSEETEAADSETGSYWNMTWEEALAGFYDFVEDRIKNGPPKFRLGSGEWSVDEWKELLDKIDEDIDTVKKELKERIEKQKEEQTKKQTEKKTEKQTEQNNPVQVKTDTEGMEEEELTGTKIDRSRLSEGMEEKELTGTKIDRSRLSEDMEEKELTGTKIDRSRLSEGMEEKELTGTKIDRSGISENMEEKKLIGTRIDRSKISEESIKKILQGGGI